MSSDARTEILGRIRDALRDVGDDAPRPVPRDYGRGGGLDREALAALLTDRVRDYAAEAERVRVTDVGAAVRDACERLGIGRMVLAPGVPGEWWTAAAREADDRGVVVEDDAGRPAAELDAVDGVLTGCALAIAETGTLVLDGRPPCGRRALTLVPDRHICVVRAEQIVERVPEAIAALHPRVAGEHVPVTFVSGSSATSDIELERVEGVHGPRRLLVLIAG
jgi:L-lactate dehydrogenase complex protein LldG